MQRFERMLYEGLRFGEGLGGDAVYVAFGEMFQAARAEAGRAGRGPAARPSRG